MLAQFWAPLMIIRSMQCALFCSRTSQLALPYPPFVIISRRPICAWAWGRGPDCDYSHTQGPQKPEPMTKQRGYLEEYCFWKWLPIAESHIFTTVYLQATFDWKTLFPNTWSLSKVSDIVYCPIFQTKLPLVNLISLQSTVTFFSLWNVHEAFPSTQ